MRRASLLLAGAIALSAAQAGAATATGVTNPANGHVYHVTESPLTWAGAEAWAAGLGGHLVSINDSAESAWIVGTLPLGSGSYWIGARDDLNTTDTMFEWVTGELWAYTNWLPGEPDDDVGFGGSGDYVLLAGSTGLWSDANGFLAIAGGIAEVVPTTGTDPFAGAGGGIRLVVPSMASGGVVSVRMDLPRAMPVALQIFDAGGRLVRTLAAGAFVAGRHELLWDTRDERARNVGSGLYFVSLRADGGRRTARVVVSR